MQLSSHVHLVGSGGLGFDLTDPLDCHVYLVDGGSEAALIDAGAGLGFDQIMVNVELAGVEPERIRYLILTHAHGDHAGGAAKVRERLPHIEIIASPLAAQWVRSGDEKSVSLDMAKKGGIYPADYYLIPCPVEKEVVEGEVVRVGDIELEVFDTPGHCDGHLAFLGTIDKRRALLGGDLVFFGGQISLQNIWDCRIQEYASSMEKLGGTAVDMLLPGHLSISLQNGQRHIDAANDLFERVFVPKAIF